MIEDAISFNNITKVYKLYKNNRERFKSIFFGRAIYKEKKAIDGISFSVKKGESVAILGKNGAGKSTLLKMITGVCYPSSGEVKVNGRVSALLELTAGFDSEFTGRENIYLKCSVMGLSEFETSKLEDRIIDFAEIGEYIDQPVRTYSSGMKARLGFSICVNVDPEILIVDEALSVGDRAFRKKCINKVQEIMSRGNITFIFVTHSISTVKEFCNRGIVLEKGKLMYDGTIANAIEYYEKR